MDKCDDITPFQKKTVVKLPNGCSDAKSPQFISPFSQCRTPANCEFKL